MISTFITYGVLLAVGFFVWKKYGHLIEAYQTGFGASHPPVGSETANESLRVHFEESGYRHVSIPEASIDEQIEKSNQITKEQTKSGHADIQMLRQYKGITQVFQQTTSTSYSESRLSAMWSTPNQKNPPVLFHIAEKGLVGGLAQFKKNMTSGYERDWSPAYPQEIDILDEELSARFRVFGMDEVAIRQLLLRSEVKQLLLSFMEVDLCATPEQITFNDPTMENIRQAMGGVKGMMNTSPKEITRKQAKFHDLVGDLFVLCSR